MMLASPYWTTPWHHDQRDLGGTKWNNQLRNVKKPRWSDSSNLFLTFTSCSCLDKNKTICHPIISQEWWMHACTQISVCTTPSPPFFLPPRLITPLPLHPARSAARRAAGASALVSSDSSAAYGRAREGWALSPGKVLTRRQERRAAPTPRERAGEQLNISAPLIYFPSPPRRHRRWDGVRGTQRDPVKGLAVVVAPLEK